MLTNEVEIIEGYFDFVCIRPSIRDAWNHIKKELSGSGQNFEEWCDTIYVVAYSNDLQQSDFERLANIAWDAALDCGSEKTPTNTSSFQFPKFDEVFWRIYKKYGTLSEREQFVLKEVYNIIVGNKKP